MNRTPRLTALICAGSVALLSGCTADGAPGPERSSIRPGPTATSTGAPEAAAQRAADYRRSGGAKEVYGIERSAGPGGVPLVVVWTHSQVDDRDSFDALKESVTGYLQRAEGLSLEGGYLMDVFGPDGKLQNRLDARP